MSDHRDLQGEPPHPRLKVLFAPDWRAGVAYQRLLAEALRAEGVDVVFFRHYYKRVLPLSRLMRVQQREDPCNLLHLHWPEAYYPRRGDRFDWFRLARFSTDLKLAARLCPIVLTAHNLKAHNRDGEPFERQNTTAVMRQARRIFAHSDAARTEILRRFAVASGKVCVVPHGDLAVPLGSPLPKNQARKQLGLPPDARVCLFFGALQPYKGVEEVLEHWRDTPRTELLAVAGEPIDLQYGRKIQSLAAGCASIHLDLRWLDDAALRLWLSAADAVVFNYRSIFTSGAACLARSYGVPILLPQRLGTVDLEEPNPLVFRFQSFGADFDSQLAAAFRARSDYNGAADWRAHTAWPRVANLTAAAYREALSSVSPVRGVL